MSEQKHGYVTPECAGCLDAMESVPGTDRMACRRCHPEEFQSTPSDAAREAALGFISGNLWFPHRSRHRRYVEALVDAFQRAIDEAIEDLHSKDRGRTHEHNLLVKENREFQKELKRLREVISDQEEKAKALETMLSGAKAYAPQVFEEAEGSDMTEAVEAVIERSFTMPMAICEIVGDGRMTKLGLRQRLAEKYPEINLGKDGVYFYKTVRRMERSGRVRMRGKMLRIIE